MVRYRNHLTAEIRKGEKGMTTPIREIPTLPAYATTEGHLRVYCVHCRKWHYHGEGAGHRMAHCMDDESPYHRTGYYLAPVGPWLGERKTPKPEGKENYVPM
jgi:hypothetical protein